MRNLEQLFADYEQNHQDARNRAIHGIGIPAIALALLGLASRVTLVSRDVGWRLDLAVVLAASLALVYVRWHLGLALGFAVLLAPLYLLGRLIPVAWLWPLLAAGVALQYLGHFLEGRQPAFHRNLIHTLVGPLWIASRLLARLRLYRPPEGAPRP